MDFKIVAAKVDSKSDAQRAYREIEDAQDAGTTDFQEVLGIWKNEKGTVRSKYYGSHARSVGTGVGLVLAIVSVQALEGEGLVLSVPYPLLVILLILAAIAGVAAAIAPARRASRINIMEALLYE